MNILSKTEKSYSIITVHEDRIDAAAAIRFKDVVRGQIEDAPSRIILDLSQVEFIDSSGLGAIVATMKLIGPDRTMELAGLTPAVAKVFKLTRMDMVFKLHASLDDALTGDE